MKKLLISLLLAALVALGCLPARAQQVPFVNELNSRFEEFNKLYNEKLRAGANLAAIDPLRQKGEAALKSFNIAAILDALGEGTALLQGRAWDEKQRFARSLTIETDRLVIEPNQELHISVVRMYPTGIEKTTAAPITVTIEIKPFDAAPPAPVADSPAGGPARSVVVAQRLALAETSTNASRRVLLPDGVYAVAATLESGGQKLAEVRKPVYAISDFSSRVAEMGRAVAAIKASADPKVKAVASLITTPEFQLQRLSARNTSRGEETINPFAEIERIERYLSALGRGQDPLAAERGEVERAYAAADGKLIPYRVYVPLRYDGAAARPLVLALHGALGDERSYFSGLYDQVMIKGEAERRGYLIAAPNGRGRLGGYGEQGQQDALEVVKAVTRDYKIDPARIYLTGHSMGGSGAWLVASARPDLFAAIAPVAGGSPAQQSATAFLLQKVKAVPALVIHGARDALVPAELSRAMAAAAEKAGLKVSYVELPDADHITVVAATFPVVMDFFEKNPKAAPPKQD
jgi:predicted esterase